MLLYLTYQDGRTEKHNRVRKLRFDEYGFTVVFLDTTPELNLLFEAVSTFDLVEQPMLKSR